MTKIFINTIVKEEHLSQREFIQQLSELQLPIAGVEIRRELLSDTVEEREKELLAIAELAKRNNWTMMYSVPESLFLKEQINPAFATWLEELHLLHGVSMKVNTGDVASILSSDSRQLRELIEKTGIKVTIENDQTIENGTFAATKQALENINKSGLPIGYTFDVGNWLVMKESPEKAYQELQQAIDVIHLKNMNEKQQPVLLDEGTVEWTQFIKNQEIIVLEYPMKSSELPKQINRVIEEGN
ncbi:sugar phosphate isomerase/epimerase family protein [Enterococcus sp. BWR-S5]|uniref:sugar phosphate isomerase/epimerase family protein n=1 Tax=Enterococcus sp. BWR-S5 TaxID=2787714 RepID=UPI0019231AFA|nr:sugar phosphate isomerase/epimerase [Enterococcus sp. BWR-S5]MBL1226032.1 sugar phosphate isomerase/epimerase [Enterococcus sp. BWR-S5]